ncbi:MAG: PIN domain-containing protein [Snowella sp.]|nr:PIN domain-containing protein [Snowella sp.]
MKKIFIDANIYLSFFDNSKPELKKLLDSLVEIKNSLFIGSQIVDEVNRNKLSVAQRSLCNHFKNLENLKKINLPEHLEWESTDLQNWNTQSKDIYDKQESLQKELKNLIQKTLGEIMCSKDKVSQTFHPLFEGALEASEIEIQAARYRREIGNPPGKLNDPLGDQISWEQFLNCSRSSEEIWIITKDSDYYTSFKGKTYLNSFLYNELLMINASSHSIFCFDSLAQGLKHFNENSSQKIDKLPTDEELKVITEEEVSNSENQVERLEFFPIIEQGKLTYMSLPPQFKSPNQYIQYLRAFDSEDRD